MLSMLLSGNINISGVIIYILSALAVIFLTQPVHEFAHAWTAVKLGDPTPRYQGRLSVNPFAHIDYFGAACILLLGFGWAKPVQVNMNNFRIPLRPTRPAPPVLPSCACSWGHGLWSFVVNMHRSICIINYI